MLFVRLRIDAVMVKHSPGRRLWPWRAGLDLVGKVLNLAVATDSPPAKAPGRTEKTEVTAAWAAVLAREAMVASRADSCALFMHTPPLGVCSSEGTTIPTIVWQRISQDAMRLAVAGMLR